MVVRLELVGLVTDDVFDLPMSQAELSQVLGMTAVHLSRTIKALRATGTVEWQGHRVWILDRERLMAAGQFDPAYLRPYRQMVRCGRDKTHQTQAAVKATVPAMCSVDQLIDAAVWRLIEGSS